jgi:general secretion pathway protein D
MNRITFHCMCLALFLAPGLMAQTDSDAARWQFAQVTLPARPVPGNPNVVLPTNGPGPAPTNGPASAATNGPAPAGTTNTQATPRGRRNPGAPPAALPAFPAPPPVTKPAAVIPAAVAATNAAGSKEEVADIYYNFPGVPIEQLLDIYADLVGRTLLRANAGPASVAATTTITLKTQTKLTRSEAIIALETILNMNGITIVPIGDKFAKVTSEASAGEMGGLISTNTNNIPIAGKLITQIVQLKYVDPKDLTDALQPFAKAPKSIIVIASTGTLILRDYAENVSRMLEMVRKIDVLTPNSIKPEVIPIKYALASDIAAALGSLGAGGGGSVGKQTSGAGFKGGTGTTTAGNGFGNASSGGGFGSSGGTSYPGQSTQGSSGLASSATSGRSTFQNNLNNIVKNAAGSGQFQLFGQTKIIADERTNSLLVFANDEDMKMIRLIIDKLDVVLPQVLIDAIVMEINLQDTRNTGISYASQNANGNQFTGVGGLNNLSSAASGFLNGTSATNGAAGVSGIGSTLSQLPGGFSYFGKYGNDLNLVLEAVAGDSRINVLSRPRIQTSHAVQADLFIGNTVPYVTGTYNYGYGSGPSSQYTQLEVGIHLQVLPLINKEGLVVMDIQADVEQLGPDVQISGVGGVPTTTKRQAGAKVAVRSGETIMLGGFISDSRSKSISGIPGLMNIPGLGNLFRSTAIENLRTELVMLMRPTVLATPEIAASTATEERNKLSGVKQAEWEIRTDETQRNLKIEHEMAVQAAKDAEAAKKAAAKAAKLKKSGGVDTSTNTIPISSIPAIEDQ